MSAPKRWNDLIIDQTLVKDYGLTSLVNEKCILIGKNLILIIYVDDLILHGLKAGSRIIKAIPQIQVKSYI